MQQIVDYLVSVPSALIGLFLIVIGIAQRITLPYFIKVELINVGKARSVIVSTGLMFLLASVLPNITAIKYPGLPRDATDIERNGNITYFWVTARDDMDKMCKEKEFGHFYFKNNTPFKMTVYTYATENNMHGLQQNNSVQIFPGEGNYIYSMQSGKHTVRMVAEKNGSNGNVTSEEYKTEQINVVPCKIGFVSINKYLPNEKL